MKKNVIYICLAWMLAWVSASCSEDDKYIPTPPEVSIINLSGKNSCLPGDIINLKVKLSSPLPTTFYWLVDGQEVSKDSTYAFSSIETGVFKVALTATNADGTDTDTLSINVHNKTTLSIESLNGFLAVPQGGILALKARINTPLESTFWWSVDGEKVSSDTVYYFTQEEIGTKEVVLNVSNVDEEITEKVAVEIYDKTEFRFPGILNWTGQGENYSALTIQWVTGEDLLNPADNEVFYRAWGYRWEKNADVMGIDMLKAVAKDDPRLYLILSEQWGGVTVKGFGYDGNNDGKIDIKNNSLHLTQADFVDGVYWQKESDDIDGMKTADAGDYWMGGWMEAYASYWLGDGDVVPATDEFDYAPVVASSRRLSHNSWDAWTFSTINAEMANTLPMPRLIKPAAPNTKR